MLDFNEKLEKFILALHDVGGLKFGDFKMKVGINSPVYFDLRVLVSHPKLMDLLANLLTTLIGKTELNEFKHICGVPYTALPIATLVSVKTNIPMLVRRKEAKDYGTRKMIEGVFSKGDECVIIEDVVTSGSSILDTVQDLKKESLSVSSAIVVLDREQGGSHNLKESGIKMHTLTSLSHVLKVLLSAEKITQDIVTSVEQYISKTQIREDGTFRSVKNGGSANSRLRMTLADRSKCAKNPLTCQLLSIMCEKETLLCLSADVETVAELLEVAGKVGPHICILKTHIDATDGLTDADKKQLAKLAKDHKFLILEDRKFADIGNTVRLQSQRIFAWADFVTAHTLSGAGVLQGLKSSIGDSENKGCFLVAQLSSEGSLIDASYTLQTVQMAEKHSDLVVGVVCQSADVLKAPHLLQLTPGVHISSTGDDLGQRYHDPSQVVLEQGADIAVVGRGILQAEDPGKAAKMYKDRLWAAYLERVSQ